MLVGAIVPLYPPHSLVGAWLATHEFLKALVDAGHEVQVCSLLSRIPTEYVHEGVRVLPATQRKDLVRRADVVVSHLGDTGQAHHRATGMGKPSVRMVHGGSPNLPGLNGAAVAICNSQATADLLAPWSGRKVVCHPPTDPDLYRTKPGDSVTLVNLSADKGGEVFWHLAEMFPDQPFLGVHGHYGTPIAGSAPNVDLIASSSNMRDEVYARTRVLLMPSKHEAWGMTAVEAMVSGIPVLGSGVPGLVEAMGCAANVPDAPTIAGWADALERLLVPSNWKAASKLALKRSGQLDPAADKARFVSTIEGLVS